MRLAGRRAAGLIVLALLALALAGWKWTGSAPTRHAGWSWDGQLLEPEQSPDAPSATIDAA